MGKGWLIWEAFGNAKQYEMDYGFAFILGRELIWRKEDSPNWTSEIKEKVNPSFESCIWLSTPLLLFQTCLRWGRISRKLWKGGYLQGPELGRSKNEGEVFKGKGFRQ